MSEENKTGVDFTKDYRNNWLNTIIKQINTCEFEIYNVPAFKKSILRMVRAVRGLLALLDSAGKEKFKNETELLYRFEKDNRLVKSYEEIERLHAGIMMYLNSTIFKDIGGYHGIDIQKEGTKL
jgi:hypothetical protein